MLSLWYRWVPSKNVSLFGPAIWPAIADIYLNIYEQIALLDYFMYNDKQL